ncbi:MAG: Fur family transcriptional regulator [Victivallaceae bacterium]|nr:Fur family transcriptional regulator [Victivallaceae bacterium]
MPKEWSASQTAEELVQTGIRPSAPRVAVLRSLKSRTDHPTAEMLYCDLKDDNPSLSLATVYNTVKVLLAKELIQEVPGGGETLRFDGDISVHGHFFCDECQSVSDIFYDRDTPIPPPPEGYRVRGVRIQYHGLCPKCGKSGC